MSSTPEKKEPKAPKRITKIRPKLSKRSLPWLIVIVLALLSLFLYGQYRQAQDKLEKPNQAVSQQKKNVVDRVAKLILLPANQTPTIITVKNASKLKGEKFYADARDGDITLVYTKEHKAILYRPSQDIIVNVAAVNVETSSPPVR